jgi:hypothetical protein
MENRVFQKFCGKSFLAKKFDLTSYMSFVKYQSRASVNVRMLKINIQQTPINSKFLPVSALKDNFCKNGPSWPLAELLANHVLLKIPGRVSRILWLQNSITKVFCKFLNYKFKFRT